MKDLHLHCVGSIQIKFGQFIMHQYADDSQFGSRFVQIPQCCILLHAQLGYAALSKVREYSRQLWPAPLFILDDNPAIARVVAAFRSGADDYVCLPTDFIELESRVVSAVEQARTKYLGAQQLSESIAKLSDGERAVLHLLLNADNTKAIAHRLAVSQKTVESRRTKLFEKLNVANAAELFKLWMNSGASPTWAGLWPKSGPDHQFERM